MKKSTPFGRALARHRAAHHRQQIQAAMLAMVKTDLANLQTTAGIHAWTGDDGANLCNLGGRLCFVAAAAGGMAGISPDDPDMRIVRGMAEALADLSASLGAVEQHRGSIKAGLAAVARLLPRCANIHIVQAALNLDDLLQSTQGVGTEDVRLAMGVAV
jgi:hypothetical protein